MNQAEQVFWESNLIWINRLDFHPNRILTHTGKTVAQIFSEIWKKNPVFFDSDNIWRLVHLQRNKWPANMFFSLLFRGIIPTTHILRGQVCLWDIKSGKKYRNRKLEKRVEFFSVEFNPDLIQESYSDAQYLAWEFLLSAFWDWDHTSKTHNVATNTNGDKFYFYDFIVNFDCLDEFPPPIDDPPYKWYELYEAGVQLEFSKLIQALYNQYIWQKGEMLFLEIYKKSQMPTNDFLRIKIAFYKQLNKLSHMFVNQNEST